MKKFLAMALALVMVLSLVACGKKDEASVYYLNFKPEADTAWQQHLQQRCPALCCRFCSC